VIDLREDVVRVGRHELRVVRPRDAADLIDEEEFERDEFLPYWAELWPSAVALASAVAARGVRGLRVLELGCGLGLPSVVAAVEGAWRVLATDWSREALNFAARNAELNRAQVDTELVDWREPRDLGAWDLVLGSDLLYEERNVEPLLALLPRLTREVLLAEPGRPYAQPFLERAASEWAVEELPERVYRLRS
jgi:predicted nicotinamide N-methyase